MDVLKKIKPLIWFLLLLTVISCSSSTRYQILSTLFDGVPDPNAKQKALTDSLSTDSLNINEVKTPKFVAEQVFVYHPPYQNRSCTNCHNIQKGNELIKSLPELCYECHDSVTEEYKFQHGPAASGNCNECHSPHLSKNEYLLLRKGNELCLYCHNSEDIFKNKAHFAVDEYTCIDCHNPHGGNDRLLLNY